MSKEITEAAQAVELLHNRFGRHLTVLANALTEIGSLDQAAQEARIRCDDAKEQAQKEASKVAALKAQAVEIAASTQAMRDQAKEESADLRNKAQEDITRVESEAKRRADEIVAKAGADAAVKEASAVARLSEVSKRVKEATDSVAALDLQLISKRTELAMLEDKLNAIRAKIKEMAA
jgi:chromosome segregation ATPase